jgi:hypothetical protein
MALVNAVAQQFARHVPGFITRQRAVDRRHQLVSLFKLAVRGLRHAHFLFQRQHFLRRFLLFRLEGFQPLVGALRRQIRQMAQRFRALQRLQRLGVLNRAGLLHVQRLLVVGKLVFSSSTSSSAASARASFSSCWSAASATTSFCSSDESAVHRDPLRSARFFLLAQRGLHQVQVIAGGLIIGFQIAFCAVVLAQLARHIDVLILLGRQLFTGGKQIATISSA